MSRPRYVIPTAPIPSVLIDTGAFYAMADSKEPNHMIATRTFEHITSTGARLFTTDFIMAESHALILTRLRRVDKGLTFLNDIFTSRYTTIVRVTSADQTRALSLVNRYTDKLFSFTDATSFIIMERMNITHGFTFDSNFRQYGLTMIPL